MFDPSVRTGSGFMRGGLGVLSELSDEDIDWILDSSEERTVAADTVVVQEGSRLDAIYFIAGGLFTVYLGSDEGGRLNVLGPGQIVGEMSFIEGRPASATARALEPSVVLCLPTAKISERIRTSPAFAARLYRSFAIMTSGRLREILASVNRFVQEAPPSLMASENSQRIAERTHALKKQLLIFVKSSPDRAEIDSTAAEFLAFARELEETTGSDSPEPPDIRDELGARVQRELLPILLKNSPLVSRLISRPRGFAGDFETVQLICGTAGTPLDEVIRRLPILRSIRERAELARQMGASFAIVPGPAVLMESNNNEMTLIDFDRSALERMSAALPAGARSIQPHFVALATGRFGADLCARQKLVLSLEFPSYLDDPYLIRFLDTLYELLRGGERLIAGFVSGDSPDRTFLRYVLNSELIVRTEEEVRERIGASCFGCTPLKVEYTGSKGGFVVECRKKVE